MRRPSPWTFVNLNSEGLYWNTMMILWLYQTYDVVFWVNHSCIIPQSLIKIESTEAETDTEWLNSDVRHESPSQASCRRNSFIYLSINLLTPIFLLFMWPCMNLISEWSANNGSSRFRSQTWQQWCMGVKSCSYECAMVAAAPSSSADHACKKN